GHARPRPGLQAHGRGRDPLAGPAPLVTALVGPPGEGGRRSGRQAPGAIPPPANEAEDAQGPQLAGDAAVVDARRGDHVLL
ncbi:hypothetical protein DF186_22765, partial [Enterococcus hirae]